MMGRPTMPPLDTSLSRLQGGAAAAADCLAGTPPLTAQAQHISSSVRGCRSGGGGRHHDERVLHQGKTRCINSDRVVHCPFSSCSRGNAIPPWISATYTLSRLLGVIAQGISCLGVGGITLSSVRQWRFIIAPLMRWRHRLPLCSTFHPPTLIALI
jgi:hypothetical protein